MVFKYYALPGFCPLCLLIYLNSVYDKKIDLFIARLFIDPDKRIVVQYIPLPVETK